MRLTLLILLSLSLILGGETRYTVKLFGMHVADVTMRHEQIVTDDKPQQSRLLIEFTSETTDFAARVYPVDGRYTVLVDPDTYRLLDFKKETTQPGITNSLQTEQTAEGLRYKGRSDYIPQDAFTIFSLLDYLAIHSEPIQRSFLLDREGELYHAQVKLLDKSDSAINYQLMITPDSGSETVPVLEKTDIFTWAVYKPSARRFIEVDRIHHRIKRCEFKFGMMSLTATAIEK